MVDASTRTTEQPTAKGSKSQPPPNVFLSHFRTISDLANEHKATGMALARAKKAAKGDGIDLDSLAMLERLAKLDADDATARLRKTLQYAVWLEMPIGKQATLFPSAKTAAIEMPTDDATAAQRAWAAEEAGHEAGLKGLLRVEDNPYPAGSDFYSRFDVGYMRGQAVIADKLGANAKRADARRGRTLTPTAPEPEPKAAAPPPDKPANGFAHGPRMTPPKRGRGRPPGKSARNREGSVALPL
jgi:hypothetical protein